jgi:hypothetical protein
MNVVLVGDLSCFHTVDKYTQSKKTLRPNNIISWSGFTVTDIDIDIDIDSNSVIFTKIDWLLLNGNSSFAHNWRNLVKAFLLPFQSFLLNRFFKKNPNCVYHALTMYYMAICYFAKIPYMGTPQGSEILQRIDRSKIYKYFAKKILCSSKYIIVDSIAMQNKIFDLVGIKAIVKKNGFDTQAILTAKPISESRAGVLSIRGLTSFYRIDEIIKSREHSLLKASITFIYPFSEKNFRAEIFSKIRETDIDLGKLDKSKMYPLLKSTLLVVSLPKTDSSPRSVYEAIFSGCCVAVTQAPWINELPECMKKRIYIVDLNKKDWLHDALNHAKNVTLQPYEPTIEAFEFCDQNITIKKINDDFYNIDKWGHIQ